MLTVRLNVMPATLAWKEYEVPNSTLILKWNFFIIKYNMHSKVSAKSSCRANSTKKGQKITLSIKYVAKNLVCWEMEIYFHVDSSLNYFPNVWPFVTYVL